MLGEGVGCHHQRCDAHVRSYKSQRGRLNKCHPANEWLPSFRGWVAKTGVWETCQKPLHQIAQPDRSDRRPESKLLQVGKNKRACSPQARIRARPDPPVRLSAESAADAGHSPWRSLEPRAAALQRRRSRYKEDQLHLWAAAAAAKPDNIVSGQGPYSITTSSFGAASGSNRLHRPDA